MLFWPVAALFAWCVPLPHAAPGGGRRAVMPCACAALGQRPADIGELLQLSQALLAMTPSAHTIAELTDAIDYPMERANDDVGSALARLAIFLKRRRRAHLLTQLLRTNRDAYVETVSFLRIPRTELPNRQDVPLRACDPDSDSLAWLAVAVARPATKMATSVLFMFIIPV